MNDRAFSTLTAQCVAVLFLLATTAAQAQKAPQYLLYANPGQTPPPGSSAAKYLFFNSLNPNAFPSGLQETGDVPVLFIQKTTDNGIFVLDNNPTNMTSTHAMNVEVYNQTGVSSDGDVRAGIRVHIDPTVTANGYVGYGVGNHGPNSWGVYALTEGARIGNSLQVSPTQGYGIVSQSYGAISYYGTEGDYNNTTLGTIGMQFNHFTTGSIISLNQTAAAMTGDFVYGNAKFDNTSPGTFTGHFINFNVGNSPVFQVNADGAIVIPAIKAQSGTRYVCVDTTGRILSQVAPCNGN